MLRGPEKAGGGSTRIGPMGFMHLKGASYDMARISVDSITKYA